MAFNPNDRKYRMIDIQICTKCDDAGYVMGTKRCETNPTLNETWKEVCPYCMPTNKYGNLKETLSRTAKITAPTPDFKVQPHYKFKMLEDQSRKDTYDPREDEWGTDGGYIPPEK